MNPGMRLGGLNLKFLMKHLPWGEEPDDEPDGTPEFQELVGNNGYPCEDECDLCGLPPMDGNLRQCRSCYKFVCADCFGRAQCVDCSEA